jgi:hypothetical protein
MKKSLFTLLGLVISAIGMGQVIIDLSLPKGNTQTVKLNATSIRLINCSKQFRYKIDWDFKQETTPLFSTINGASSGVPCNAEIKSIIQKLDNSESEDTIKKYVDIANKIIPNINDAACTPFLKAAISETEIIMPIPYAPLNYNQTITLTISRFNSEGKDEANKKWTFIIKTEEKSRWLVHYGLTYTPNLISKTDQYFSQADTSRPNYYTITKKNDDGPKAWENISATINFTYPFHPDSRSYDGGITAGFGLSAGFELSGHAGVSAIIGENVILGTGIAFMQKYKLNGEYKEGQVVKTDLNFEALHHKVWMPELYFTIGFRFSNNPFAKKEDKSGGASEPSK